MKKKILIIFPILNHDCTFRCRYCEAYKDKKKMRERTIVRLAEMLNDVAGRFEKVEVCFFGGEPLLEFSLIKRCAGLVGGKNIRLSLITNGSLLDRKKADFLIKNNIHIRISIDGGKLTQGKNRIALKGDSHDIVSKKIAALGPKLVAQNRFTALMTVHPDTAPSLGSDFLHLIELGFRNFSISPAISGKDAWRWNIGDLAILASELRKVRKITSDLKAAGLKLDFIKIASKQAKLSEWVGNENIGIDTDGNIYSTDSFLILPEKKRPELLLGNVFSVEDFSGIYAKRKSKEQIALALTGGGRYLAACDRALESLKVIRGELKKI